MGEGRLSKSCTDTFCSRGKPGGKLKMTLGLPVYVSILLDYDVVEFPLHSIDCEFRTNASQEDEIPQLHIHIANRDGNANTPLTAVPS